MVSNDTDVVARLLRYVHSLRCKGLQECWVEYSTGERRRLIPLHNLAEKMGYSLCQVLVKAHILTGDDVTSKIGTKLAALHCEPVSYLSSFGEQSHLSDTDIAQAEEYLVRVWSGARSKPKVKIFDELRAEVLLNKSSPTALSNLPPTSSVIRGHITRAFYCTRQVIHPQGSQMDCCEYGWQSVDGTLKPTKHLKPLPTSMTITCSCSGKCANCPCRRNDSKCVAYCHKKHNTICQN